MNPLHGLALARRPVIKNNQVDEIFANIEEIINYHTMLLEGLERRVSKFDKATCLGEFFISMVCSFSLLRFKKFLPKIISGEFFLVAEFSNFYIVLSNRNSSINRNQLEVFLI